MRSDLHLQLVLKMRRNKHMSHRRNVKQQNSDKWKKVTVSCETVKKKLPARSFPEAFSSTTGFCAYKRPNGKGTKKVSSYMWTRTVFFWKASFFVPRIQLQRAAHLKKKRKEMKRKKSATAQHQIRLIYGGQERIVDLDWDFGWIIQFITFQFQKQTWTFCETVCVSVYNKLLVNLFLHVHSVEQIRLQKLSKQHLDYWDFVMKPPDTYTEAKSNFLVTTAVTHTFSLWLCVTQGTPRSSASALRTLKTTLLGQVSARPETIITAIVLLCLLCCG